MLQQVVVERCLAKVLTQTPFDVGVERVVCHDQRDSRSINGCISPFRPGYLVLTGASSSQNGCPISKKYTVNQGCMSLSTYFLEYGRHVSQLRHRRRRRAQAHTSNTASHDNREKINSRVSFSVLYEYEAPLCGPSDRRSSANILYILHCGAKN